MSTACDHIHRKIAVKALGSRPFKGWLSVGNRTYRCALGRSGIVTFKREGDGGTPRGRWRFERIMYRADRISRPRTRLPVHAISPVDGWCDDPAASQYNCQVRLPNRFRAETLKRADNLYDVIVVLSHNRNPRVRNLGSAIFMHVAPRGYGPTEGCIALKREHLLSLLKHLDSSSIIEIA